MAWWDSSTPGWVYNLVPTYAQEIYKFRIELEGEIDILANHPGHQHIVSQRLTVTAKSLRKIKILASDISVYFPDSAFVAHRRPGFFQTTFPRLCDFIENTLIELSRTVIHDPRSELSVAWQLQDLIDSL
ncbi:hypothetical protein E8E15_003490 [Penicillium rubens]|mgnify:CR=1 FL=1|jgi:hypothetical protein|uniref:uncharacterized protein n=1 Tax=Penicillium rubens TaxID=1108849 RepID=UPI001D671FC2|nr:uncharacterized protein N7525_009412 [Penicillium rubens]KAF3016927.1 hypothetical protein E8E15_003490 [Penicillium rubens]KAJ5053455.1 hypothetical protein NUH16_010527 [Penicillium rubens]KAJ5831159.1 hypothetical protein N7525_009412 [Penicillium rubens]KAJ5854707.1 hypothetical protein N7534_007250 [Penicillium rubens]